MLWQPKLAPMAFCYTNQCILNMRANGFFKANLLQCKDQLLIVTHMPDISVGDSLEFHHHTAITPQVHQCLEHFRKPGWTCENLQSEDAWQRMANFVQAFMPKLPLVVPPLTVEMWKKALQRFRPAAARGADGWARSDLLNTSPFHTRQLIALLSAIEDNQTEWPKQLLEGLVIAIAKCDDAHRHNEYRPIVLLSIIYRCWASLRARQMLAQLEMYIHSDAHGFLPSREPGQTWLHIQAAVETAIQSKQQLAGIGTDFVKAFNCISRKPLWFLAEAVGIPNTLLHPWRSFVQKFTRRFVVCNEVSKVKPISPPEVLLRVVL